MIVKVSSLKCWLITLIFKSVITSQHHLEKGPRRSLKLSKQVNLVPGHLTSPHS